MKVLNFEGALPSDLKNESILKSKLESHEGFDVSKFHSLSHNIEQVIKHYIS